MEDDPPAGDRILSLPDLLRPGLKLLFMTGYTRNAIVHAGVLDPDVQMIAKPFSLEQLAAKLTLVLAA